MVCPVRALLAVAGPVTAQPLIGSTGPMPSARLPAGALRALWPKPIQHAPHAASIRFSAANAQSTTIHGPGCSPAHDAPDAGAGRNATKLMLRHVKTAWFLWLSSV